MKIKITMKNPDALDCAIDDAFENETIDGLSEDEQKMIIDSRKEEARDACTEWMKYGEYITVEIDTEKNTAIVLKNE